MKLSKKKEQELYNEVHESIMQVRLKIWAMRFQSKPSIAEIDNLMSDLCIKAPKSALDVFHPHPQTL